ncbi:hypothetical protein [Halorhodospira abdelmalekii]|uniref:hypothetical protein n=1 Tax=Halorhodospira abdelmalekii TaxID=421629 RepID=UPI0019078E7B|nr:hypothetical protein [Halorhodospira abdelmalekii]
MSESCLFLTVSQNGNQVELVSNKDHKIFYEVEGLKLPQLSDFSFAVWHFLPYALKTGADIHVTGPVDPATLQNAMDVSVIWEMWEPSRFRSVTVTADATAAPPPPKTNESFSFFSGGVDSTHMLLEAGAQPVPGAVLSVHGMEYNFDRKEAFNALVAQTATLLDKLNYHRIILRTNARMIASGHHAYGMALAGHAHLLSGHFRSAFFAADLTSAQDFLAFPWGLNHITNRFFSGTTFSVSDTHGDMRRGDKLAALTKDETALNSISVCKDKSIRPNNCGVCKKCLRTKLLLFVTSCEIPNIFVNQNFGGEQIRQINLQDPVERLSFIEAYQIAARTGSLERCPDLKKRFEREIRQDRAKLTFSAAHGRALVRRWAKTVLGQGGTQLSRSLFLRGPKK